MYGNGVLISAKSFVRNTRHALDVIETEFCQSWMRKESIKMLAHHNTTKQYIVNTAARIARDVVNECDSSRGQRVLTRVRHRSQLTQIIAVMKRVKKCKMNRGGHIVGTNLQRL